MTAMELVAQCRVCGCTDSDACEGGCGWVESDLCSMCVGTSLVMGQTRPRRMHKWVEKKRRTICGKRKGMRYGDLAEPGAKVKCLVCFR